MLPGFTAGASAFGPPQLAASFHCGQLKFVPSIILIVDWPVSTLNGLI